MQTPVECSQSIPPDKIPRLSCDPVRVLGVAEHDLVSEGIEDFIYVLERDPLGKT